MLYAHCQMHSCVKVSKCHRHAFPSWQSLPSSFKQKHGSVTSQRSGVTGWLMHTNTNTFFQSGKLCPSFQPGCTPIHHRSFRPRCACRAVAGLIGKKGSWPSQTEPKSMGRFALRASQSAWEYRPG